MKKPSSVLASGLLATALIVGYSASSSSPSPVDNQVLPAASSIRASTSPLKDQQTIARAPSARGLIQEFLGISSKLATSSREVLAQVEIECLIATIPDPEHSRLPFLFDVYLDAMQRAAETAGYVQDRVKLPWKKERAPIDPVLTIEEKKVARQERVEMEQTPGIILFRRETKGKAEGNAKNEGKRKLLVLFLVGETPTGGVYKNALKNALQQASEFTPCSSHKFKILGPALSGSATSITLAVKDWLQTVPPQCPPDFNFIGTATAMRPDEFRREILVKAPPGTKVEWHATVMQDEYARQAFYDYVLNKLKTIKAPSSTTTPHYEIAFLTEGSTTYGQSQRPSDATLEQTTSENYQNKVLNLTFPLHISRLRNVTWKSGVNRNHGHSDPFNFQAAMTPLPLEEEQETTIPIFSAVSASYAEVALATILEEIERQKIRYLGIAATDVRDRLFLAHEIRRHSPNLVLFFLGSELLFLHPEVNRDLQGSLLVSTYPLAPQSKLWSHSFSQQQKWLQFPVQGAQGVYNAALALMENCEAMQEYEAPSFVQARNPAQQGTDIPPALWLWNLWGKSEAKQEYEPPTYVETPATTRRHPALWLSVVGRDNIWPLTTLEISKKYLNKLSVADRAKIIAPQEYLVAGPLPPDNSIQRERLHSEVAYIAFYLFVFIVCLLPAYELLANFWGWLKRRYDLLASFVQRQIVKEQTSLPEKQPAEHNHLSWQWGWMIFGELIYPRNKNLYLRRQIYLTGCLLAMLCLSLPVWLISHIPYKYPDYLQSFSNIDQWLITGGLVLATLMVALHFLALLKTALVIVGQLWEIGRQTELMRRILQARQAPNQPPFQNARNLFWGATHLLFRHTRPDLQRYRRFDFGILVVIVIGLPLTALILLGWIHFLPIYFERDKGELILLWERTVGNFSGISPLMPLALIATGTLSWTLCSLRRLRLLERNPHSGTQCPPEQSPEIYSELDFLSLQIKSQGKGTEPSHFEGESIARLEQRIHQKLSCSLNRLPGWFWTTFSVVLACVMTMGARLMPSVEGLGYNRGITTLFILAYLAIALNFLRFLCVWVALRRLLRRLSWHPLLMGYCNPEKDKDPALGRLRLDLSSPLPTFTTLTKSVTQARLFGGVAETHNFPATAEIKASIREIERSLNAALNHDAENRWAHAFRARNKVRVSLINLSQQVANLVRPQWITEIQRDFGESKPAAQIPTDLSASPQTDTTMPTLRRPGPLNITQTLGVPQSATAQIDLSLEFDGELPTGKKIAHAQLAPAIQEQGERFLVSRLIGFLQYVLAQMQNLMVFVTAGILLMLAAVLSYPFQPMSPLLIFNWVTIISIVSITMLIFIEMNRNPTLSLLSGTTPGELEWNSQFILQVVVHGLLPVLAITGAQFSDSLRETMTWLGITSQGAPH